MADTMLMSGYVDHISGLFLIIIAILAILYYVTHRESRNLPPGPYGWPVLGSLPTIGTKRPFKVMVDMSKRYGEVFSMNLGLKLVVVLNGSAVKEALVKYADYFSSRASDNIWQKTCGGRGLVNAPYGESWREHRRFTLVTLRKFGMGKSMFEERILTELYYLMAEIDKYNGQPMYMSNLLPNATANVIFTILFGKRYEYNDPNSNLIIAFLRRTTEIAASAGAVNFLPFLQWLPGFDVMSKLKEGHRSFAKEFKPIVDEHRENLDLNSEPRDIVDAYLQAIENHRLSGQPSCMDTANLDRLIIDLFGGGAKTSASTMDWAILRMMINPDIQKKVQAEIDNAIGRDRRVSMADRLKLPYTEATLMEVNRISSVTPFAIPHGTSDDVVFRGHFIPKNTTVFVNVWSVQHDPELWTDPEVFRPERFIENGKTKPDDYIHFSLGRRSCVGKQLASMELMLFFTTLLQHYTFTIPPGMAPPTTEGNLGIILSPKDYKVCVKRR